LFLPKTWSDDRARCRKAKIPDDVVYRPKWRIALEQLTRALANGLTFNWLTFDEYYGGKPAFLKDLDTLSGMSYVGEIPRNFRCLATRPRGRKPKNGWKGKRADNLARFSSALNRRDWQTVSLTRLTLANQEWEVRTGQVYLVRRGELSDRTYWLIVAHNLATKEVKYFLSNAPADTPVAKLLRVAFTRWNVEHTFRVAKSEIGFGHFEGRSYVGLMRHMILCLIVMGFVAEHTDRLRGGKSGDDDGTSVPSPERAVPDLANEPPRDNEDSVHSRGHCLSPAA
jgi:SRSO17 transposase